MSLLSATMFISFSSLTGYYYKEVTNKIKKRMEQHNEGLDANDYAYNQ